MATICKTFQTLYRLKCCKNLISKGPTKKKPTVKRKFSSPIPSDKKSFRGDRRSQRRSPWLMPDTALFSPTTLSQQFDMHFCLFFFKYIYLYKCISLRRRSGLGIFNAGLSFWRWNFWQRLIECLATTSGINYGMPCSYLPNKFRRGHRDSR